ncbi:cyclic nucleotide-binding domain-containing protein 2-like isoform X1 [Ascaphus truei]|uniref:cyclic nucleotide-binding domain-containing protein 2-like isoform X1 n=1 Tax=Ascaphus truei TaxID=8439 RepID=UPI003F59C257
MESTLHTNTSLLNGPEPAAHAVEGSTDENDNETEAAVKGEYFLQCNLPEACENMEQTGSKIMFTTQKHLHKFRTAVLIVQVIRNLIKMYRDYAASRAEPISFTEYAGFETETDNLLFDRSYFKAKMEMVVSSEAQFILSSPPDKRTLEGIKLAMLSLRATVDTFAGYPVHIQEKLANVGWYECFGPGRVIIRQGHVPQNFYLILSGTAVVTKVSRSKNTGEHFSKTVAFLKKGKYFGDVAILTMAKRNATVVCHDTVSLLAISRQDFLNIFLNSESQEGPEYIRLLHSIDLLSGWPIHKLPYNNPRICVHTFYRPGTVITKDSKASSKIYVIKTGSVRVLNSMTTSKPLSSSKAYKLHGQTVTNEESAVRTLVEKNEPENEDSSCNFIEEEYLLPVLQMDRKLNEKTGTNAKPKGFVAPTDQSGFSKISGNGKTSQIFIHIQTLRAGDIFGLVYTVFEDTLSMALVSDGAECIVISKEFFKKQMDEEYIFKLSRYIQPYPSKEMLQMKMQDYINWKAYKSHLFKKHH